VVSERNVRAALAALVLLAAGCDWSLREVLSHPTVEQRVRESLAMPPVEPPPVNPDSFRFAMFGDPQVRKDGIHRLGRFREHVVERGIDFVCVLGDLTHDATEEQIQWMRSALDSLGVPVYAAPGNHDLYQTGAWDRFKEVFGPGCQWFRAGRVRIILFDTAGGIIGPTQFRWLEEQLSLSADEIKVLGTHFPLFDGGMPDLYRLASEAERYRLASLLRDTGAWGLVSGHMHYFRAFESNGVRFITCGSMAPKLDGGEPGYLLLNYAAGELSWQFVVLD